MTQPRQVLPDRTLLITRRCAGRRMFLRPDPGIVQLFEYLLAVGADKYGLDVLAAVALSNHYHGLFHDPHGRHPDFTHWFNGLMARAGNCFRQRHDAFWSAEQVNVVEVADADAVIDRIAYIASNPVEALLVEHGRDWPGVRSNPQSYVAGPKRIARPDFFFRKAGSMPEFAYLEYKIPPSHRDLDPQDFSRRVAERIAAREADLREQARQKGKTFLGVRGILKRDWRSQPKRPDLRGPDKIRPHVAASDKATRTATLSRIARFRRAYHEAREAFINGDRDVAFPEGTWAPRQRFGVACAAAHSS